MVQMKRNRMITLAVFLLVSMGVFFHGVAHNSVGEAKDKEVPFQGGVYRRPLEFMPRTFDPALTRDIYSITIIQQLFDGLIQIDQNLNVIPAIARSWKISSDGLTYTFFLREGVKFHNGREIVAEDFVYSFTRMADLKNKSPAAHLMEKVLGVKEFQDGETNYVKGFKSLGKYTMEIKLSEPFYPFISALATYHFKVLPKEEVERAGSPFARFPIGSGPFKFISMKEGEEIVLEANSDYFEGRAYLDKIIFKIFHGALREKILKEFKEGGLEESFIPPEEIEDIAKGILPPGMPGYDPQKHPYSFNKTQAKKFLSKAGYPEGQGIPTLQIWSASKSETAQKELNEIQSQLGKIGIRTDINFETNWPNFVSMLKANKTPVFIHAWYADFPDPDNFLGILFHSQSKYNFTAYHNPKVDLLLDQAKAEKDYLKRMEMYRKIEEIIMDDAPIIPMVNHLFQMVYQPYVRGIEVNALGGPYVPMKKIWLKN